jgi:hypothetical protein
VRDELDITLTLLPHPVPEWRCRYLDPWGRFVFTFVSDGAQEVLLDWQWGLDELAEWFTENQHALRDGCQSSRRRTSPRMAWSASMKR